MEIHTVMRINELQYATGMNLTVTINWAKEAKYWKLYTAWFFRWEIQKNVELIYGLDVMIVWPFRGLQWPEVSMISVSGIQVILHLYANDRDMYYTKLSNCTDMTCAHFSIIYFN